MAKQQMSEEELDKQWEKFNEFRKNDTRTPDEIFAALCDRLRQLSIEKGDPVPSDQEIEKGARNLIGFCETIMKINDKKRK